MRKLILFCFGFVCWSMVQAATLTSPNGKLTLMVNVENGEPVYTLKFQGKSVVNSSKLGLYLEQTTSLQAGFTVVKETYSEQDEIWHPVLGEVDSVRNHYRELSLDLLQTETQRTMRLVFRLFNDGLGFRYEFDKQPNLGYFRIADECTEFAMAGNHTAFWIPGSFDTNEYFYTTSRLSDIDASKVDGSAIGTHGIVANNSVQTPVMMKTDEGLYLNIFEAALVDYAAMCLTIDKQTLVLKSLLAPSAVGTKVFMQTPCKTPWRTILVSDKAADILSSKTILNLNEPCKLATTDWIKPMKYVGIWWEMHVPNKSSWNYADEPNVKLKGMDWQALKPNGRHGATTENTKRYIDFAAQHGFDGVLVEGWNVGWEDWAGNWKEEVFDFVTPYPDFEVNEVTAYAASKGVKLIMHHETSSAVTNYERRLDDAFDFMKANGYNAVKTGYVGKIIPRGELHDGQWMVNHYNRVIEKAANRQIMVNAHEQVRPTGLSRTYPNLLACEAARGNEFNAWSVGNPPEHETILPFTRLLGGGMDYTPGIFELKMSHYQAGNTCQVHTTLAKQLALYVTMYSPLQMAADLPENYEKHLDAFQFIKDVDVDWSDTRILEAEPGDYITIARFGKQKKAWFVGSITDENSRVSEITFDFLEPNTKYVATIYADAVNADWKENPHAYTIRRVVVSSKSKLKQAVAKGGGYAISIKKVTDKAELKGLKTL